MKTVLTSVGVLALTSLTACGSEAGDPPAQQDFDHGTVVNTGTGGGGNVTEPPYLQYAYPIAPFGSQIDSVIAPLTLLGWKAPIDAQFDTAALEAVTIADFYNPDGKKPWKLIWVNSSAVWCGPCNKEYAEMRDSDTFKQVLEPKGVAVIGTLMENISAGPAAPSDLKNWADKYQVKFPMALDPAFKMGQYFEQATVPGAILVDAKTMKIVAKLSGGAVAGPGGVLEEIDAALANLPQ
jgi:thiol-disulfide isomerase/thioredoxin